MKVDLFCAAEQAQFSGKYTFAYAPACTFSCRRENFFPFNCTRSHCHKTKLLHNKHNLFDGTRHCSVDVINFLKNSISNFNATRWIFHRRYAYGWWLFCCLNLHIFFSLSMVLLYRMYVYISFTLVLRCHYRSASDSYNIHTLYRDEGNTS